MNVRDLWAEEGPRGGEFMRGSAHSGDSYLACVPGPQGISGRLENKDKWLSIFIMRFSELPMTCLSPLLYFIGQ